MDDLSELKIIKSLPYKDPLKLKVHPLTGKKLSSKYYKWVKIFQDKLPIYSKKVYNELRQKLDQNDVLIFTAGTGVGKSIGIIPIIQRMYNYKKKILISEPRTVSIIGTSDRFRNWKRDSISSVRRSYGKHE